MNTSPQSASSKASYAEKLQAIQAVPVRKQIPVDSGLVEAPLTWDTMTGPQQFQWLDSVQPALPGGGIAAAIRDVAKDLWQQNLECPLIGLAYGGENFCTGFERLTVGGQSLVGTILTAAPPAAAAGGVCILAGIVGCVTAAATTSGGPSIADNAADFTTPNTPPPATNGTGVVDDAISGGRHSEFLDNYAGRSPAEIQRGIRSLEGQIGDHLRWIDDPYQKIPDWDKLDPRQQQALLTQKWPGDIQRQREQLEILRYLLEQGGS